VNALRLYTIIWLAEFANATIASRPLFEIEDWNVMMFAEFRHTSRISDSNRDRQYAAPPRRNDYHADIIGARFEAEFFDSYVDGLLIHAVGDLGAQQCLALVAVIDSVEVNGSPGFLAFPLSAFLAGREGPSRHLVPTSSRALGKPRAVFVISSTPSHNPAVANQDEQ
jgi:hypothetical protein